MTLIHCCFNVLCPLGGLTTWLTVIWCIFRPWTGDKLPVPEKHRMKFSPAFYWDDVFTSKGSLLWTESSRPSFQMGLFLYEISRTGSTFYPITMPTPTKGLILLWNTFVTSGVARFEKGSKKFRSGCSFVCIEVLRPTQPNGVMSSEVSLPNHTFTGQA